MIKKLSIGVLLFPSLCLAVPDHSGLYRDADFNLNSYQGAYLCKIYPMPANINDRRGYVDEVIGEANVVVENEDKGTGKYVFVNLNNGKDIETPLLPLAKKGSSGTTYGVKLNSFTMIYSLTPKEGTVIGIQDHRKGNNLSVMLGDCTLLHNQEAPAPADMLPEDGN
ncbi:hypothetical protein VP018_000628 [Morganella morganii]|nr:hypothetical protein [Morganella morganii]